MRKRIGTKIYDTDKAVLVDTLPDGIQVYRKTGRSEEVFIYNPNGDNKHEMFFTLPEDEAKKYLPEAKTGDDVNNSPYKIKFSPNNRNRIKRLAASRGMSMAAFLIMLVDEYEQRQK